MMKEYETDSGSKEIDPYRIAALLLGALALVLVIHWLSRDQYKSYVVKSQTIKVDSLSQIELLQDSLVKPLLYSHVANLNTLEQKKAKRTFISVLLPAVLVAKHNMKEDSLKLTRLAKKKKWSSSDSTFFLDLQKRFKAKSMDNLLARMGTLPNSIVLAQAAVETGWGQSRFFLEGNNVFGIWSFNSNEPRLQASSMRENTSIYVKAYDNISESITDYFKTLSTALIIT